MTLRFWNSALPSARFAGALILSFGLLCATESAYAAEEPANAEPKDDDEEAPAAAPEAAAKPVPTTAAVEPAPAVAAEEPDAATGLVERLPPSAYPAPVMRGIHGGSLWLSSQGVQWPYLPRTTIGVSGYGWVDSNYRHLNDGLPTAIAKTLNTYGMQGRLVLRVTPTFSHGEYFAQAQAEFVANHDQTQSQATGSADTDDVWVRVGKWNAYDLTVGRFEAFEVYHLGMGLDVNTDERKGAFSPTDNPPGLYSASFLYYRPNGPGNLALHAYPTRNLRFEVLGQAGPLGSYQSRGVRGAAIFDIGWFKLKAAGEYQYGRPPGTQQSGDPVSKVTTTNRGFAGGAQFVIDPYLEFGANFGYALSDLTDNAGNPDTGRSNTVKSFGGFINARIVPELLAGVGVNDTRLTDTHFEVATNRYGTSEHLQSFAALQYFWESQLIVKLVVSYAKADFNPSFAANPAFSNNMLSARLRLQLLF